LYSDMVAMPSALATRRMVRASAPSASAIRMAAAAMARGRSAA